MSRTYDIFLSHSGAQKDFVEDLNAELAQVCAHYSVFFDQNAIEHGDQISKSILEHARTCKLAVAVVSEEYFTRSKSPMMELAASYTAAKASNRFPSLPCLLPVFLALRPEDAKDSSTQLEWWKVWDKWEVNEKMSKRRKSRPRRVQPTVWKEALDRLLDTRGPIYIPEENGYDPKVFLKKVALVIARKLDALVGGIRRPDTQVAVSVSSTQIPIQMSSVVTIQTPSRKNLLSRRLLSPLSLQLPSRLSPWLPSRLSMPNISPTHGRYSPTSVPRAMDNPHLEYSHPLDTEYSRPLDTESSHALDTESSHPLDRGTWLVDNAHMAPWNRLGEEITIEAPRDQLQLQVQENVGQSSNSSSMDPPHTVEGVTAPLKSSDFREKEYVVQWERKADVKFSGKSECRFSSAGEETAFSKNFSRNFLKPSSLCKYRSSQPSCASQKFLRNR